MSSALDEARCGGIAKTHPGRLVPRGLALVILAAAILSALTGCGIKGPADREARDTIVSHLEAKYGESYVVTEYRGPRKQTLLFPSGNFTPDGGFVAAYPEGHPEEEFTAGIDPDGILWDSRAEARWQVEMADSLVPLAEDAFGGGVLVLAAISGGTSYDRPAGWEPDPDDPTPDYKIPISAEDMGRGLHSWLDDHAEASLVSPYSEYARIYVAVPSSFPVEDRPEAAEGLYRAVEGTLHPAMKPMVFVLFAEDPAAAARIARERQGELGMTSADMEENATGVEAWFKGEPDYNYGYATPEFNWYPIEERGKFYPTGDTPSNQ